ncbi:hypothetical protein CARUB_v10027470mg [Capsella rubella]|uniref:Uncharacterized protein n=1 Tax=Capsella rubella TaxID=81985 RepID=R0EZA4_9BRAS|nr:hypothetical protein CARUB_v10027470mg [Capsella rubella]
MCFGSSLTTQNNHGHNLLQMVRRYFIQELQIKLVCESCDGSCLVCYKVGLWFCFLKKLQTTLLLCCCVVMLGCCYCS